MLGKYSSVFHFYASVLMVLRTAAHATRIAHGICCRRCLYCIRQEDVLNAPSLANSAEQQLVHEINVRLNIIV